MSTITEDGWIHLDDRPTDLEFHRVDDANVFIDAVTFGQLAEADLPHGEWLPLLAEVGLKQQAAQMMMAVARDAVLTNPCNAGVLPAGDYTTLYQLSRLPEPDLRAAIDAGEVRPDMRRAELHAPTTDTRRTT